MKSEEQLKLEIRTIIKDYALSKEGLNNFYGQAGGVIHECALTGVVKFVVKLLEEIEQLKLQAGLKIN